MDDLTPTASPSPEASAPTPAPAASPAPAAPAEPKSLRSGLEEAFDASAKTEPSAKTEAEAPVKPEAAAKTAETPAETPPAVKRPIPERLKAQFGEKWETLDPTIRDTFHQYESHIGRLADKFGKDARAYQEIQQITAPYQDMIRKEGGTLQGAVSNLFETARILRQGSPEQKVMILRQTAQAFGVPLESLTAQRNPELEALAARNLELERADLTSRAMQDHTASQQVDSEIEAFTSNPANVYLQEPGYLETMAKLVQSGQAKDLQDAYNKAAWLHEKPRQLEIARMNQQRLAQQQPNVQRARLASASVNGQSPGPVRVDASKLSLRDTLAAAMDGELS
jgi:hypothetical protein